MSTIDLPDGLPDFGAMAAGKAAATVGLTSGSGRGHFPNLNPQQQQIVAAPTTGVVQSIAGAGCGKTTGALLPRAQQLYRSNPGLIYILAFNTSVKEELESKIEKLLDPAAAAKIKPKTIAGLARGLVLNNLHHLGLPRDSNLVTADWVIIKFLKEQMEVQSSIPVAQRMPHFQPVFNSFRDNVIKALFDAEEKATAQGKPIEDVAKEYDDLRNIDPLYIKSFIFWNRAIRLASGKLMWRDLVPLASHLPAECYENLHVKHVLVDEAQDLSVEQHGMIKKLVETAESATFVGDPSQCFVAGTLVETEYGPKPIETIEVGEKIRSASGGGETGFFAVKRIHRKLAQGEIVVIKTESGREIRCTPEHTLFTRMVPDVNRHYVYMMYRQDLGYRVGITRGYRSTNGCLINGLDARARQEGADQAWVLKACASKSEALVWEQILSTKYGLPQICFEVGEYTEIDGAGVKFIFGSVDTQDGAYRLTKDLKLTLTEPHWVSSHGDKAAVVTYLTTKRGPRAHHALQWETSDEQLANQVSASGLSLRAAKGLKHGKDRWRVSTTRADYGDTQALGQTVAQAAGVPLVERFNLTGGKSWEMTNAGNVFAGMQVPVLTETGIAVDVIAEVTWETYRDVVYDLDVEQVHNYSAGGIVVHNCIYKWNGARPDLFMGIPKQYPGTQVFYMEINYRSDQPILDLANHVLRHLNSPINLKTPYPRNGEPVRTTRADKDDLVKGVQELLENGVNPDDIAVLARINAHMLDLEVAFSNAGIPYQCWSGSFFEHAAVNDMLSYFRVLRSDLDSQQCVTEDDWETVVGHTKFLGSKTIEETWLRSSGDPLADVSVPGACRSANQRKLWHDLVNYLDRLKRVYGHMPHAFAMDVFKRLEPVWADRWADDPSKKREAGEVAGALLDWISKYTTMEDLFAGLSTLSRKGSTGVVLSTVHKAKGMEWDYVFLWKVGKGFPQTYAWSDPEEEACIFYVGATRARHILTLCYESYPQEIPYGLDQALCPAQYVVTESLPSATPGSLDSGKATWGMYNVCQRCPRQLECLVGSQAS